MPILPPEPFAWPEDLFTAGFSPEDSSVRWWALHTKPRTEKSLSRHFLRRKLAFFLPLARKQWQRKGRRLISSVPLFPGYIFLRGDNAARLEALATHQVVKCLEVADQAQLHGDLARIHRLMLSGVPMVPEERLRPGSWVEITRGPLRGLQGKILRRGKRWRFIVEVHFLQRGASVEIDADMIQPSAQRTFVK